MNIKSLQVIINPASGKDQPVLNTLNTVFGQAGIDWDVSVTKGAGDAQRFAEAAARNGCDAVAVYGGDGTVAEVAAGLVGTDVPIALLPGGTANAVAQELKIPPDLTVAAQLLVDPASSVRRVDLGRIGHRYFLIAIGVGIPGTLAENADRESKDRLGFLAYAISSLQAVRSTPVAQYRLTLDGMQVESEGVMCLIANGGNFGVPGLSLAPNVDIADGLFDVMVFRNADLTSLLSVAASVVRQDEIAGPVDRWQAREVGLVADPVQSIQADGEVLEPGPVAAELLPQAVQFVVPGS